LVETSRTSTDPQGGFQILTPAGLEVQIFVDPKDANNVPAELKEKIREEMEEKGNLLIAAHQAKSLVYQQVS